MENLRLNVALLRKRVPNLTTAAKSIGIRPATVSNLCTGKIDVGKAEVRTLVGLATLANCSLDELIIKGEEHHMIETHIKTLDFFAPLVKGGMTGIVARPGMGQLVIVAELMKRLKETEMKSILLMPKKEYPELQDNVEFTDVVARSFHDVEETLQSTSIEYVLFTDHSYVKSGELLDFQDRLNSDDLNRITTVLFDLTGDVVDEDMPYGPLETLWKIDADLAARHLYPAVHPIYSTSSLVEGTEVDSRHFQLRMRAQKLLRRYRELRSIVHAHGKDRLSSDDLQLFERGERLEAYFTQPFYVAEPFTNTPGAAVSLNQTLIDVESILDGKSDRQAVDEMKFIGSLA